MEKIKKKQIDEILQIFGIQQSIGMIGCPYNNVVTETEYKIIKTKFIKQKTFS